MPKKIPLVIDPRSVAPFISANHDPDRYRLGYDGQLHERKDTCMRKVPQLSTEQRELKNYKRIIPFESADKRNHEKWSVDRDLASFPKPFRALFVGPPGVGKTTSLKNILSRMEPQFAHVVVVSRKGTNEWSEYVQPDNPVSTYEIVERLPLPRDVYETYFGETEDTSHGFVPLDEIFPPHEDDLPKLIVLDDHTWDDLAKVEQEGLIRLMNYSSTHNFISVAVLCQDGFNMIKPIVRRAFNVIVAFAYGTDPVNFATFLRSYSIQKEVAVRMLSTLKRKPDFICIDRTPDSPAPLRVRDYWTKCIVRGFIGSQGADDGRHWHNESDGSQRQDNEDGLLVL
jgi:hypothetical protein